MNLEGFPPLQLFWERLRRIGVNFSSNIWLEFTSEASGSGLFFVRRYLVTNSIFLLVQIFFFFIIQSDRLCVSMSLSLSSGLSILLVHNYSLYSLIIFYFYKTGCKFPSFISDLSLLSIFS